MLNFIKQQFKKLNNIYSIENLKYMLNLMKHYLHLMKYCIPWLIKIIKIVNFLWKPQKFINLKLINLKLMAKMIKNKIEYRNIF